MGLYNRNYMQFNRQGQNQLGGYKMLMALIVVNVVVFLLCLGTNLAQLLALNIHGYYPFHYYQLFTAMFVHASLGHLFFNMFGLFIFGSIIADKVGYWKMLQLYLTGGLCGNVLFLLFYYLSPMPVSLVGASGALFGIMAATAMLEPNRQMVLVFLPMYPIKMSTLVVAYAAIELFSQITGPRGSIAHLAHLGGFVGGYFYTAKVLRAYVRWRLRDLFRNLRRERDDVEPDYRVHRSPGAAPNTFKFNASQPVSQKELDYLLDKISRLGINGLSEDEQNRLRQAREQMKNGN